MEIGKSIARHYLCGKFVLAGVLIFYLGFYNSFLRPFERTLHPRIIAKQPKELSLLEKYELTGNKNQHFDEGLAQMMIGVSIMYGGICLYMLSWTK